MKQFILAKQNLDRIISNKVKWLQNHLNLLIEDNKQKWYSHASNRLQIHWPIESIHNNSALAITVSIRETSGDTLYHGVR